MALAVLLEDLVSLSGAKALEEKKELIAALKALRHPKPETLRHPKPEFFFKP